MRCRSDTLALVYLSAHSSNHSLLVAHATVNVAYGNFPMKYKLSIYGFLSTSIRVISLISVAGYLAGGAPATSQSYASWAIGTVDHVTSTPSGLIIRLSGGVVPQNCVTPPEPFILIPQADQVMVSFVLSRIMAGKLDFIVYTNATTGTYCSPNQISRHGPI